MFWNVILLLFVFKLFKHHENEVKTNLNEQKAKYEYKTPTDWSEKKDLSNEKKAYFDYLCEK